MDKETRDFLQHSYRYLENHHRAIKEVQIVTLALRKTILELGPEAEKIYAKQYHAESTGLLKTEGDAELEFLARCVRGLTR